MTPRLRRGVAYAKKTPQVRNIMHVKDRQLTLGRTRSTGDLASRDLQFRIRVEDHFKILAHSCHFIERIVFLLNYIYIYVINIFSLYVNSFSVAFARTKRIE